MENVLHIACLTRVNQVLIFFHYTVIKDDLMKKKMKEKQNDREIHRGI